MLRAATRREGHFLQKGLAMTRFRSCSALLLATLTLGIFPAVSQHGQHAQSSPGPYVLIDLGTLGGPSTQASDMNNEGEIVGYSATATHHARGFLWDAGSMTALGTLDGGNASWADAVNSFGHVVGSSSISNGFTRAVLWRDGGIVNLTPDIPVYEGWSNATASTTAARSSVRLTMPTASCGTTGRA